MNPRIILITGGSGKFGQLLVQHFLTSGHHVVTTCHSETSAGRLAVDFANHAEKLNVIRADLTSSDAPDEIISALDAYGLKPDALINNARSVAYLKMEADGTVKRDNFANEFLLDVIAPYELTMALVGQKDSRLRSVVNIGSMYGLVAANPKLYTDAPRQSPLHYGVAKAALSHLTKELAVRLADRGVRVNCVAFGGVEGRVDEAFKQRYAVLCPSGRMLKDHEVVGPVDMLVADTSSGMTGQTIAVDGGWSIW